MKDKILDAMQKFSRAVIQPTLFLTVTGLVMALCTILKMDMMPQFVYNIGDYVYNVVFNSSIGQLSILFCMGISVALAKKKKTDAAVMAVLNYFVFLYANNAWLTATGMLADPTSLTGTGQSIILGIQATDMSVFLGIILGCMNGYIFNKFCDVEFPDLIRLYGGSRCAAMVSMAVTTVFAIAMCYVWPVVNSLIVGSANLIESTGYFGFFIYGFLNRVLIPTGLHSLINMPFLFTSLGGTAEIAGEIYTGSRAIMQATMGNLGSVAVMDDSIKYMMFGFSKMFGSIGVGLAFIRTAKPENRKATIGMIVPIMFSAALSGITEPLEFLFCFLSFPLWLIYSVIDGIVPMIAFALGGRFPIAGGWLSSLPLLISMPTSVFRQHITLGVGIVSIAVWYFAFVWAINKWDIKTPGRVDIENVDTNESTGGNEVKGNDLGNVQDIIDGLGGKENIVSVNNCFSRLRVEVKSTEKIDEAKINKFKNTGIIKKGNNIQIIIGLKVQSVREDVCKALGID